MIKKNLCMYLVLFLFVGIQFYLYFQGIFFVIDNFIFTSGRPYLRSDVVGYRLYLFVFVVLLFLYPTFLMFQNFWLGIFKKKGWLKS